MTDDEFLEKVVDYTDRWSKGLIAGIGGYLISLFLIAWNVTDWVLANARDNLGALAAFAIGGILTGMVAASIFWRHVVRKAIRLKDDEAKKIIASELKDLPGFEHVSDLGALLKKTRGLATLQSELSAKDEEIEALRKSKRKRDSLFEAFMTLTRNDQLDVMGVYLSEPHGMKPSEGQKERMGDWVVMNRFVRLDPSSGALHLKDGVADMLLENPGYVYELMAAMAADLKERRSGDLDDIASLEEKISDLEKQIAEKPDLEPMSNDEIDAMFGSGARTPRGRLVRSIDAVRTLPAQTVGAMVDAFDNEGHAELGAHEQWVRKSIKDRDGIFRIGRMYFMGYPGEETGDYYLMKEWLEFMDDPKNLAEMRQMARG